MQQKFNYVTKLDARFNHLEKIDVPHIINECKDKWYNETLTHLNDTAIRLGIVEGEYHWHKHDNDDEFFFVLGGKLLIDLEDKTIELNPFEGYTVSKGIVHRTRALQKTIMLMVGTKDIQPTGD